MAAPHTSSSAVCPTCGAVAQDTPIDPNKRIYLTFRRLVDYLDFTEAKTRHFLRRNPTIRRVRVGKYLLVWRRDVDEALATAALEQEQARRVA